MNQQINLYLPAIRKKKDWLSVPNMGLMVGLFVAVLLITSLAKVAGSYGLKSDVEQLQAQVNEAINRSNALVDSYGVQSEDPQLASEVVALEENLNGKKALLSFLDGRDIGNTDGFSEYFADLARYHIKGLRLTSINLRNGGESVFLRGEVSRAENVPLYIQSLRNGDSYSGKNFETLRITNTTGDNELDTTMVFDVATTGAAAGTLR